MPSTKYTLKRLAWRFFLITGDTCVLDRWHWVAKHLRAEARTFDAGAGSGVFAFGAAAAGCEVVGASFSEAEMVEARRRARALGLSGVDFRVIDLRELADHVDVLGAFDQIFCLETIEHLTDDAGLLRTLAGMLSPGGQMIVTSPYVGHRPQLGEDIEPSPVEDGSHVRYGYTPERLESLLRDAGLQVQDQGFVSGRISQAITNVQRRLGGVVPARIAWLLTLPLRPIVLLDSVASRGHPYLCVAATAVRPLP